MSRRAFGPQRIMSPAEKARNVVESILTHNLPLDASTWTRYGLTDKPAQRQLVEELYYETVALMVEEKQAHDEMMAEAIAWEER